MSFETVAIIALGLLALGLATLVVAPTRRLPSSSKGADTPPPEPARGPPDVVELLREADQMIKEGELDRASLLLSQATAVEPERPGLLFVQGRLEHARGEPERAVRLLERACDARPDVAPWHVVRGHVLLTLQRPELASEAFGQALEVDPESADAQAGLAEARALMG
ncbi:MAG: tetratricopeptide repeat protein [Alphaproteobacteria bacterium]|nr:tetratricopeptide repeat protein [Alphaproteobacteria bacterium]